MFILKKCLINETITKQRRCYKSNGNKMFSVIFRKIKTSNIVHNVYKCIVVYLQSAVGLE